MGFYIDYEKNYVDSFNRTFMELKLTTITQTSISMRSFNRTFMELKSVPTQIL